MADDRDLGFLDPSYIAAAKRADEEIKKDPIAKKISAEASAAIAEIEDIYWGGGSYDPRTGVYTAQKLHSDELLDWIQSCGIPAEELQRRVKALTPGQTMILKDRTFIKTAQNKFQEVQAYVNQLEKAVIKIARLPKDEIERINDTVLERDRMSRTLTQFENSFIVRFFRALGFLKF